MPLEGHFLFPLTENAFRAAKGFFLFNGLLDRRVHGTEFGEGVAGELEVVAYFIDRAFLFDHLDDLVLIIREYF